MDNTIDKKIIITGISNKYQINKLKKEQHVIKIRKIVDKLELPHELYSLENQINIIYELFNKTDISKSIQYTSIIKQIETKLCNYKQQDLLKKIYNEVDFITFDTVINKLYECHLNCYYCKEKIFLLYNIVREMKQWTLDRNNNDIGHNTNNVVISCLDCNLKRRRINMNSFLFTKQLNIVKT